MYYHNMIKDIQELDCFFNSYNPSMGSGKLRNNRLDRMRILLSFLNNPDKAFQSIHIAGSKGKGTTATYIAKIIEQNGYKCGLYMSPHVYDLRERFTLAGNYFSTEEYLKAANELESAVEKITFDEELGLEKPTTFELYTAFALLLFKNTECKYAVIETGLGGRLDATNVIEPIASVFTTIELEHTNVLGNTITEIASEKAGIIKKGIPVFTSKLEDEAFDVIENRCRTMNSKLYNIEECKDKIKSDFSNNSTYIDSSMVHNGREFHLSSEYISPIKWFDSLYAFFIVTILGINRNKHIKLSEIIMPARYEERMLHINPDKTIRFVFDGAHTPKSAIKTMEAIAKDLELKPCNVGPEKAVLLFSLAEGKNAREIISIVLPYFKNVIITSCGSFKKSDPEALYEIATELFPSHTISLSSDPLKATITAIGQTPPNGTVFVIGSFYLCSEIDKALKELNYES